MSETTTRVIEFETIDSTNSEAQRRALEGERGPLWIRSDVQQSGRGRSGRAWSSPPGNLSATFLFAPKCERPVLHQLAFVAALAGHDAIAPHLSDPKLMQLKWPNDLLIEGAKVGGILIESSQYGGDCVVMIGMGINITVTPPVEGRAVTRMDRHGAAPTPKQLMAGLAAAMSVRLATWNNGAGFGAIQLAWLDRAHPLGARLGVHQGDNYVEGTFAGLADNGALLLTLASGEIRRIEHGDVSLAARAPASDLETHS